MPYEPFAGKRQQIDGVDAATNIPGEWILSSHNEMSCNPRSPDVFALMCLQDAQEGGESLLARNADLTQRLPERVREFVTTHGGVRYTRRYADANAATPQHAPLGTWQDRCSLGRDAGRDEAEAFWLGLGFDEGDLTWEDDGALTVSNVTSGLLPRSWRVQRSRCGSTWRQQWRRLGARLARKVRLSRQACCRSCSAEDECYFAFKLRPGDMMVLDNKRVQHGRLPYRRVVQSDAC
jgi:Taurine catabolism dioxygenase TauD, TfdA family